MADKGFEVMSIDRRKLGTYYRLNATGKTASAGLVSVKHTLRDTLVCLTCIVAHVEGAWQHKGCEHTRVVQRYIAQHGAEEDEEGIAVLGAQGAGTDPDIDEDYQ